MPDRIIKDGAVVDDSWQVIRELEGDLPAGKIIVPAQHWLENKDALQARGDVAVWLASDQSPKLLGDDIKSFELIAVDFPAFADGRGFSYGRELRERGFSGELRAIGGFMRDQLAYLTRCGFNSFALENADLDKAVASLKDFSVHYQVSIDNPQPIFRARQG
ncbi:uncharacterized protein (DUF934 family) [Litorivivens lipolytica]|uniref:Uncharacterized protein (DUF934 family) n=1 Tax=Litorivivens lipolytica TaxID=1524264 RepID=A0A7W4W2N6_9GAMM|nr:DUF934 domain-containing protein [Litorivivens lipolytica]MBB3046328.1 uncharacterized protein (DUF934 family) [Litorivivens lipolytica]